MDQASKVKDTRSNEENVGCSHFQQHVGFCFFPRFFQSQSFDRLYFFLSNRDRAAEPFVTISLELCKVDLM